MIFLFNLLANPSLSCKVKVSSAIPIDGLLVVGILATHRAQWVLNWSFPIVLHLLCRSSAKRGKGSICSRRGVLLLFTCKGVGVESSGVHGRSFDLFNVTINFPLIDLDFPLPVFTLSAKFTVLIPLVFGDRTNHWVLSRVPLQLTVASVGRLATHWPLKHLTARHLTHNSVSVKLIA